MNLLLVVEDLGFGDLEVFVFVGFGELGSCGFAVFLVGGSRVFVVWAVFFRENSFFSFSRLLNYRNPSFNRCVGCDLKLL